ncbi:uncharacterized protein LOC134285247 [Aedes albopictus]|uniref:Putative prothoracicotropic hormone preproprotein n=1 Tax=Aedes albopictus TaxID=7160 RepID=A0A1W7R7L3_AEDAL
MKLMFLLICATYWLTIQVHGKIKFGASPLFENVFLSSDFDQKNLAGLTESESLNCFPPADRHHRYEWAGGFNQNHILDELEKPPEETNDGSGSESEAFDEDRLKKRNDKHGDLASDLFSQYPSSCACQTKYELLDLTYTHFPRYVVNAVCQNRNINSRKCWRGSRCKEIPYKVRVLTMRAEGESIEQDHHSTLLPEPLRDMWRFKTITIAAACQCSI